MGNERILSGGYLKLYNSELEFIQFKTLNFRFHIKFFLTIRFIKRIRNPNFILVHFNRFVSPK